MKAVGLAPVVAPVGKVTANEPEGAAVTVEQAPVPVVGSIPPVVQANIGESNNKFDLKL